MITYGFHADRGVFQIILNVLEVCLYIKYLTTSLCQNKINI